jgi:quercetin dioxygenase-like cupin family protein
MIYSVNHPMWREGIMPPTEIRKPIVIAGATERLVQQPVRGSDQITKVVHHQNFETGGHLVGLSVATHQPGAGCDEHDHRGADEQFIVTDGYGIITLDGEAIYVQAGNSVFVPAGVRHSVAAAPRISDRPFVVACLLIRAKGHEDDLTPWVGTSA